MLKVHEYVDDILCILPPSVRSIAIVGGGALRSFFDNTDVKDFDLFFRTHEDWLMAVEAMTNDPLCVGDMENPAFPTFTYRSRPPFNLIGFRHKEPEDLMNSFDFLCCCMVAFKKDGGDIEFLSAPHALSDATHKQLSLNKPQPIRRLLKRTSRYVAKYGYQITDQYVATLPESLAYIDGSDGEPDDYSEV